MHINNQTKHSEEIDAVITAPPSWLMNYGILLFTLLLIALICIATIITYPDTLRMKMRIVSLDQTQTISAPITGVIKKLNMSSQHLTNAHDTVVTIENGPIKQSVQANATGNISYIGLLFTGQHVLKGQHLFHLYSKKHFMGQIIFNEDLRFKINPGQKVLVDLKGFATGKSVQLRGAILYIGDSPADSNQYIAAVELVLPDYSNKIDFVMLKDGMQLDVKIITKEERLINKLLRFPVSR